MLEKDYEGSICEVKTLKNVMLTTGRIDRIEGTEMEISDPSGPMPLLPYKTPVKIAVFNTGLGFRMMAGQVYVSNPGSVRLMNILDFLEYERRRFFRLDIDAAANLVLRGKAEDSKELEDEPLLVPVRVKNLSLCGVLFETDRSYHEGEELVLKMALYKNQEEEMKIVIHRAREWENTYGYGAEIVDLNSRVEQNLSAYLFDQQRQQINKSKGREK